MNLGLHLVHFPRSNPALKRYFGKARFLQLKNVDCGINSEAVYAAKATSKAVFYCKTRGQPECNAGADLAFTKCRQEICEVE